MITHDIIFIIDWVWGRAPIPSTIHDPSILDQIVYTRYLKNKKNKNNPIAGMKNANQFGHQNTPRQIL